MKEIKQPYAYLNPNGDKIHESDKGKIEAKGIISPNLSLMKSYKKDSKTIIFK